MRRVRNSFVALLIGLSTPLLIWVGAGAALYQWRKRTNLLKRALPEVTCSTDAHCPPGYVCMDGCCVPEEQR